MDHVSQQTDQGKLPAHTRASTEPTYGLASKRRSRSMQNQALKHFTFH